MYLALKPNSDNAFWIIMKVGLLFRSPIFLRKGGKFRKGAILFFLYLRASQTTLRLFSIAFRRLKR
jgi:hypothetical protein